MRAAVHAMPQRSPAWPGMMRGLTSPLRAVLLQPFSPARKPVGFVEDRQGYRRGTVNMQIQGGGLSVVKPVLTDQRAIVVKDQPMTDSMAHADFFRR